MNQAEVVIEELPDWSDTTPEPNLTQIEAIVLKLRERLGEQMALEVCSRGKTTGAGATVANVPAGDAIRRAKRGDGRELGR